MKNTVFTIAILALLNITNSFAQDKKECEKIVALTFEAINNKSYDNITKHLSPEFTFAGQNGVIAVMILPQVLKQLNIGIIFSKKIDELQTDNELKLVYQNTYEEFGKQTATFIFDKDNRIKVMELLKMDAKVEMKKP